MWISGLIILQKTDGRYKFKPQSSFINIHWLLFISRPGHMQITPDTEGYLSIGYSKSTYSTNMAAGNLSQGALILMTWTRHQF